MLVLPMCMLIGSNVPCTASCVYLMCTLQGVVQGGVSSKDNINDFLLCVFVKGKVCVL